MNNFNDLISRSNKGSVEDYIDLVNNKFFSLSLIQKREVLLLAKHFRQHFSADSFVGNYAVGASGDFDDTLKITALIELPSVFEDGKDVLKILQLASVTTNPVVLDTISDVAQIAIGIPIHLVDWSNGDGASYVRLKIEKLITDNLSKLWRPN